MVKKDYRYRGIGGSMQFIFQIVYLIVTVAPVLILLSLAGKKYVEMVNVLDKKEFGMRDLFPIGFQAMDMSGYKYGNNFDRKLRRQIRELYNPDYTEFYLRVYWAGGVTFILVGFLLSGILNFFMGTLGLAFGIAFGVFAAYSLFNGLNEKVEKRHMKILIDMPDFTNKILILSGAGMTLRAAIIKISDEMSLDTPLYRTLTACVDKMKNGETDEAAFEIMSVQCNTPQMRRFVSVVLQNMKRGGSDVITALRDIGMEQWAERKATAMRISAEADTKLLFPMMLMLFSVIIVTVAPAILSMNI